MKIASRRGTVVGTRPGLALALVLLGGLLALGLSGCSGDDGPGNAKVGSRTLPTRTAEVGSVEVSASPRQIGPNSAVFAISLDTHSGDLNLDVKKAASLTVAGTTWRALDYRGDGPGGHHRSGTLRFRGSGPVAGTMRLTLTGLGRPASFTWTLGPASS